MTLVEHLTELRTRAHHLRCRGGRAARIVMFFLYNRVLHFLSGPYEQVTKGEHGVRRHARRAAT